MSNVVVPVISLDGKNAGEISAAPTLFAAEINSDIVHFVCEGQRFRFYKKTACTKTRSAVRGGGKKIKKQKGTGGARQGGIRAPHWVGGGVVFGPSGVKRNFKLNRQVKAQALASILSDRAASGQVRVLKSDIKEASTSSVNKLLNKLELTGARVGFVVSTKDVNLAKSVRNLKKVDLLSPSKWTALDFIKPDTLIFSEDAFQALNKSAKGTK